MDLMCHMREDGESDTRKLEETEEDSQILERSKEGDVGDAARHDEMSSDVRVN